MLKGGRKIQVLITTHHKDNSGLGCHQWQYNHFSLLRLQLQILPVRKKQKTFTTIIFNEFSQWRKNGYNTLRKLKFNFCPIKIKMVSYNVSNFLKFVQKNKIFFEEQLNYWGQQLSINLLSKYDWFPEWAIYRQI